jgi:hypothetical protein
MQTSLPTPAQDDIRWLCGLHELARNWIAAEPPVNATARTGVYVDLTFAFALASIGAGEESEESEERSRHALAELAGLDDAHVMLQRLYGYRIAQARQGMPHAGTFPKEMLATLNAMDRLSIYVVDRLRNLSHILHPDQRINPHRLRAAQVSPFEKALADLTDLTDRDELASRLDKLFSEAPEGMSGHGQRVRVLSAGLEMAPRIGAEFARKTLDRVIHAYDAFPKAVYPSERMHQGFFLARAILVARYFQFRKFVEPFLDRVRSRLGRLDSEGLSLLRPLLRQSVQLLTALRLADELDSFLGEVSELILRGGSVEQFAGNNEQGLRSLQGMLCLAEGWYGFGWDRLADPVVQLVWALLLSGNLPSREQSQLACHYVETLGKASGVARARLENIFRELRGIRDTYTTSTHFSVAQLEVVETVALAAVEVCRHH